jgi:hypothetical protein
MCCVRYANLTLAQLYNYVDPFVTDNSFAFFVQLLLISFLCATS